MWVVLWFLIFDGCFCWGFWRRWTPLRSWNIAFLLDWPAKTCFFFFPAAFRAHCVWKLHCVKEESRVCRRTLLILINILEPNKITMPCQNKILRKRSSRKLLAECFCWSEKGDWLVQSLFSWSARAQCDTGTVHAKTAYLELTDSLRGPQFEARLRQCRTQRQQQHQATPAAEWNVATIAAVWVTSLLLHTPWSSLWDPASTHTSVARHMLESPSHAAPLRLSLAAPPWENVTAIMKVSLLIED